MSQTNSTQGSPTRGSFRSGEGRGRCSIRGLFERVRRNSTPRQDHLSNNSTPFSSSDGGSIHSSPSYDSSSDYSTDDMPNTSSDDSVPPLGSLRQHRRDSTSSATVTNSNNNNEVDGVVNNPPRGDTRSKNGNGNDDANGNGDGDNVPIDYRLHTLQSRPNAPHCQTPPVQQPKFDLEKTKEALQKQLGLAETAHRDLKHEFKMLTMLSAKDTEDFPSFIKGLMEAKILSVRLHSSLTEAKEANDALQTWVTEYFVEHLDPLAKMFGLKLAVI